MLSTQHCRGASDPGSTTHNQDISFIQVHKTNVTPFCRLPWQKKIDVYEEMGIPAIVTCA